MYQCSICLELIKEYKGTEYYPYIPMSWRFSIKKSIAEGAYYHRGNDYGNYYKNEDERRRCRILHIFPYDDEYNKDSRYEPYNISLCTRFGQYDKSLAHSRPSTWNMETMHNQVIIQPGSGRPVIDDIAWLIAHKFRHEKQNLFIGGSYVLSKLRPDLDIKPYDIDVFVTTSLSSFSFYKNAMKSLFETGDPSMPIHKIDVTRMSETKSFFHYNDLTITRPVMVFCKTMVENIKRPADHLAAMCTMLGADFKLRYHSTITRGDYSYSYFILATDEDLRDVQTGCIGVRLKHNAPAFQKTKKRIQKYKKRGFSNKIIYHELIDKGSVNGYMQPS